jgi:RimJ/RimL family protein N-acetyltransferase
VLRDRVEADAARLDVLDQDPRVMEFFGPYAFKSVKAYRERFVILYAAYATRQGGLRLWGAVEKSSGEFLGWIFLRPVKGYRFADAAELGDRWKAAACGCGDATEESCALVGDAFRRGSVETVVATALETNRAPIRVTEECGLRFAGRFQLPGFGPMSVKNELTRSEWVARSGKVLDLKRNVTCPNPKQRVSETELPRGNNRSRCEEWPRWRREGI